jgi:dipeptidyl aminopeptidase/acylaminoacyl peptidase
VGHSEGRAYALMRFAAVGFVLSGALLVAGGSAAPDARAQTGAALRLAQVLEEDATGVSAPVGIAFSSQSKSFYVLGRRDSTPATETDVAKLAPFDLAPGSNRPELTRIGAAVQDPINVAFDPRGNRLLLLGHAQELLEVRAGSRGDLDRASLHRTNAAALGLRTPQGLSVDT